LHATAPNDWTRLADFCRKWLESTQLQLVQNKFIKIIVIVLLEVIRYSNTSKNRAENTRIPAGGLLLWVGRSVN
jgi:hypothetical protein